MTDGTNPTAKFDYVTGAVYSNLGPLEQLDFANTVRTTLGWNKRYQLTSIYTQKGATTVHLNLGYGYNANGQIRQFNYNNSVNSTLAWKYEYDELGRLLTAQRGPDSNIQTKYTYDYDRYGNRWGQILNAGTGYNTSHSFAAASNRVTTTGFTYDTSGNQTATGAGTSFAYNQENFLTTAGASVSCAYDAQNRRPGAGDQLRVRRARASAFRSHPLNSVPPPTSVT